MMYEQLDEYLNNYFNDLLYNFRKSYSTQHAMFRLIHPWKKELDNSGLVEIILVDLSKAFNLFPYNLLIANLKHMFLMSLVLIWLIIT